MPFRFSGAFEVQVLRPLISCGRRLSSTCIGIMLAALGSLLGVRVTEKASLQILRRQVFKRLGDCISELRSWGQLGHKAVGNAITR